MKTRREFFRTLAGSAAVMAACVIAPKSLIASETKNPFCLEGVTSGYMKLGDMDLDTKIVTVTTTHTTGWSELLDPNINRL